MSAVDRNGFGTATVELTIPEKAGGNGEKSSKIVELSGVVVEKDANFENFVENYINPSADRNKFKKSKYFINCFDVSTDFKDKEVTKAVISYKKISKRTLGNGEKQKTKTFTVENPLVIIFHGHFFLCCDSLESSNFLEKYSKKIRINQTLDLSKSFYGLTPNQDKTPPKFISFKISQCRSQSNIYKIDEYNNEGERVLGQLKEAGPLILQLDDKKTIVGCYRIKDEEGTIEIKMFGKIEGTPQIDTSPPSRRESDGVPVDTLQVSTTRPPEGDPKPSSPGSPEHDRVPDNLVFYPPEGDPEPTTNLPQSFPESSQTQDDLSSGQHVRKYLQFLRGRDTWPDCTCAETVLWAHIDLVCSKLEQRLAHMKILQLADHLGAPPSVKKQLNSNISHSPTLALLQMPKISNLTVYSLVGILREMSRNDVANRINHSIPGRLRDCLTVEDAIERYNELFEDLASILDRPNAKNWKSLGRKLGFQSDQLDQIEYMCSPGKRLLDHAHETLDPNQFTVGWLRKVTPIVEGPSTTNFQDPERDFVSIKDDMPPGSNKMRMWCLQLNKVVDGEPKWKRLARYWGISDEISSRFAEPIKKKSPIEILLKDWLIVERPDFTVNELCSILGKIGCKEAKECLEGKLQEWCTKPM